MKTWQLLGAVLGVVLLISIFSVWFVPSLQSFMTSNSQWNGIKNSLKEVNGKPIPSLDELDVLPEESIIISVPYLEYTQSELEKIKNYVMSGGTLMLVDDYGFGNEVLVYLGTTIRFDGKPLLDPLFCYSNPWLPKITDFTFQMNLLNKPKLVYLDPGPPEPPVLLSKDSATKISLVVLNHATALVNVPDEYILAESSPTSYIDRDNNGVLSPGEQASPYPVAAKLPLGKGTVILVSDPSIFINGMLNQYDNLKFIEVILKSDDAKDLFIDVSHLPEAPLDNVKSALVRVRDFLGQPYPILAVVGITFVSISWLVLKRGGSIGRQS